MLKKYRDMQADFWLDGWTASKIKGLRAIFGPKRRWPGVGLSRKRGETHEKQEQ